MEVIMAMKKTNKGLVEYAKAQIGLPYWYGTFGNIATKALHVNKRNQYPSYYKAKDFEKQYGKRVHDCVGLIKGYIWSDSATGTPRYNAAQDKSAAGMYAASKVKGMSATFPKKAGQLLYKGATPAKITHVGIYGGDGYVYEAKGHASGVVKTKYEAEDWPYWSQCPYIENDGEMTAEEAIKKLAKAGVINTAEYWIKHYKEMKYLDELLINMAKAI